ncbi:MAG: cytidylate kinase [Flavobacteriaceae bacterium]|nr:cytidylate kinase [Flavobacteriaceae bacterium]|tara:strand:- start:241 stop:912 length:672 start_codon:yes stop_codon:yes gene_type:complete
MKDIIVAIDGNAATGKSTQSKKIALYLNYQYIDSGAMYRAVTLYAIRNKILPSNLNQINSMLSKIKINFKFLNGKNKTFLNGEDVEKLIRSKDVANKVSSYAKIKIIREFLISKQREFGINKRIVMEGRDIGTVVFPKAECKFFFKSDVNISANRRYKEIIKSGSQTKFEDVLSEVSKRDITDKKRAHSPLKKAKDSIEVDVSNKSISQIFEYLIEIILRKIK